MNPRDEFTSNHLATLRYTSAVVRFSSVSRRMLRLSFFSLDVIVALNSALKYFSENWYIGSTSAMLATTKYMTEPRVAMTRYFSRAALIFFSVVSASFRRCWMTPEVTCKRTAHDDVDNLCCSETKVFCLALIYLKYETYSKMRIIKKDTTDFAPISCRLYRIVSASCRD